jgi:hypothetical protein
VIRHCPCCPYSIEDSTKKRRNGEGSVYFSGDRRLWVAALSAKPKRLYAYAKTQDAAHRALAQLRLLKADLVRCQ